MRSTSALSTLLLVLSVTACSSVDSKRTPAQLPPLYVAPPPASAVSSASAPSSIDPERRNVATAVKVIVLPQGVTLSDVRVVGRDLVVTLPDGKKKIIPDGAVSVPQLVIGGVEVPASSLAALLINDEEEPHAGEVGSSVRNVSTRLFVPAGFAELGRFGAVAIIAFPQVPASIEELNRHRRICEAYLTTLPDAIVTRQHDRDLRQMVTIWPRRDITKALSVYVPTQAAAKAECERAISNYSYPEATAWLARVPKEAAFKRAARGPFLVAWAPPSGIGKPKSSLLIFDLSDFEQTNEIQRAFRIWREEIEEDPELWEKGWNIARWKARTAAKLDGYGKQITSALVMVPWLKK